MRRLILLLLAVLAAFTVLSHATPVDGMTHAQKIAVFSQDDQPAAATGTPASETFTAKSIGGFSTTNDFKIAGSVWGPGQTLWLSVNVGPTGTGSGVVISAATSSLSAGWYIEHCVSCGANTDWIFGTAGGSFMEPTPRIPRAQGPQQLAFVWHAAGGGDLAFTEDGDLNANQDQGSFILGPACTSCVTHIGNWEYAVNTPLADERIYQVVVWNREATPAEQQLATSMYKGSRYYFPPWVTTDPSVTLELNLARDYSGSCASPPCSVTTQGAAPTTWTVTGSPAPTLTAESETCWNDVPSNQANLWDSHLRLPYTSTYTTTNLPVGQSVIQHDQFARWCFTTDANYISATVHPMIAWSAHPRGGATVNGSFFGDDVTTNQGGGPVPLCTFTDASCQPCSALGTLSIGVGTATGKTVCYVEGERDTNDFAVQCPAHGWRMGTPATRVCVPNLTYAGLNAHTSAPLAPTRPVHRVVLNTDSRFFPWGDTTITLGPNGGVGLNLRYDFPADGITMQGGASLGMDELDSTATPPMIPPPLSPERQAELQAAIAAMDGTGTNTYLLMLGQVDACGRHVVDATYYQESFQDWIGRFCAGNTSGTNWQLYITLPVPTYSPSTCSVLGDYLTALETVVSTCAIGCSCHVLDCTGTNCTHGSGDYDTLNTGSFINQGGVAHVTTVVEGVLLDAGLL